MRFIKKQNSSILCQTFGKDHEKGFLDTSVSFSSNVYLGKLLLCLVFSHTFFDLHLTSDAWFSEGIFEYLLPMFFIPEGLQRLDVLWYQQRICNVRLLETKLCDHSRYFNVLIPPVNVSSATVYVWVLDGMYCYLGSQSFELYNPLVFTRFFFSLRRSILSAP